MQQDPTSYAIINSWVRRQSLVMSTYGTLTAAGGKTGVVGVMGGRYVRNTSLRGTNVSCVLVLCAWVFVCSSLECLGPPSSLSPFPSPQLRSWVAKKGILPPLHLGMRVPFLSLGAYFSTCFSFVDSSRRRSAHTHAEGFLYAVDSGSHYSTPRQGSKR